MPTGGGKTLLATHILGLAHSTLLRERNGTGLAVWVVPSEQIYRDSSDECVAIVAHELVEARLAEAEMPEDEDARDVAEVIERARNTIRAEADAAVAEARRRLATETAALSETHETALRAQESRASAAERTAGTVAEDNRRLRLRLQAKAQRLAGIAAMSIAVALALPFAAGAVLSLPDALLLVPPPWRAVGWVTLGIYIALSVLAMCTGFSISSQYRVLRSRFTARILAWLSG